MWTVVGVKTVRMYDKGIVNSFRLFLIERINKGTNEDQKE